MKEEHSFFPDMFKVDFYWVTTYHHPLRYCSDMMYSGHTFVVTVFALGCYELVRVLIDTRRGNQLLDFNKCGVVFKIILLATVAGVAICEQAAEIYFVLESRFHYTSDVFVAILITFLFYTNGVITVAAKQWEVRGIHLFLPKACEPIAAVAEQDLEQQWRTREMWKTKGDVFVPPCCVPFCCMAGRQHIYSDGDICDLYDECRKMSVEAAAAQKRSVEATSNTWNLGWFRRELNLGEGVSSSDIKELFSEKLSEREGRQRREMASLTKPMLAQA
eukprot:TRINITY_DN19665_c0_g1_i1.p1 TRINITY_DN19665_c0_g1~~TRINITY_DN19665_c0_g1_i1.p1  ORF type:complete len:275 (-),score=70.21 TRINITY_DN19665_c0_g1_i1:222-1046(-)